MNNVVPFLPINTEGTTTLIVEIEFLHHVKPHHSDSDARRQEKASMSAGAKAHERTWTLEYPRALERWCAADLIRIIEDVRAEMPMVNPTGFAGYGGSSQNDPDRWDGRALCHVHFTTRPGVSGPQLWFSTSAGYAASIAFPACPPVAALIPLAFDERWGAEIDLTIPRRSQKGCA